MGDREKIQNIIQEYKNYPESVYNTWFIDNDQRLKAFGAIRRGVEQVINDIKENVFPNDFKGSSLEVVLTAITEQKQVFEGAAHPFYWKPKLRIPDIYENNINKSIFGQFLESCLKANKEEQIYKEIIKLSNQNINELFGEKKKLGSWNDYLEMRDTILQVNDQYKNLLSKDLGAISGLLFDIGVGKVVGGNADNIIEKEEQKRKKLIQDRKKGIEAEIEEENMHTKVQYLLLKIGKSLGYNVIVASNDRTKSYNNEKFSFICLPEFPEIEARDDVKKTIGLIDVIWFEKITNKLVSAYEVEKSTSIYSGILRLTDLALTIPDSENISLYLVAPEQREKEIVAQLKRPSLISKECNKISYILFSELCTHCDSICKFGNDHTIMEKVARCIK
ncbi:MAG: hypothetical protein C3F06_10340 [Candidatus Methanoperedenaceae archaeon]|nr:MAG: hypothetical protein C3F06_10340 [Candidatus Methanoperedenaceae archaeon]